MRTITSKEAQNSFGAFLDSAQREPVMVTRRNRPVGVMLSMENLPNIFSEVNCRNNIPMEPIV
jgi:prevent-host-death family protein